MTEADEIGLLIAMKNAVERLQDGPHPAKGITMAVSIETVTPLHELARDFQAAREPELLAMMDLGYEAIWMVRTTPPTQAVRLWPPE